MLTKAMARFMGSVGECIPTDIIHILNPPTSTDSTNQSTKSSTIITPRRRRHSYNNQQSSRTTKSHHQSEQGANANTPLPSSSSSSSASASRSRSNSIASSSSRLTNNTGTNPSSLQQKVERPQVWIRVPESDLITAWTALSGFYSSLDTGNYGVIDAGIRVVRASRYLMSTTGPLRSKW